MYQYQTRAYLYTDTSCICMYMAIFLKIVQNHAAECCSSNRTSMGKKIYKNQNNSIMCTGFIKYSILASTKMQVYSTGIGASLICAF